MIEKALRGGIKYWGWVTFLTVLLLAGIGAYMLQLRLGLGITGLSRDVSWGLYIANFTFFVGVAASAVMVVLPYYLHHQKQFGRITVLGEFLAVSAVIMSMLFIVVDLGQPSRVLNIILYPSPNSVMFWDLIALSVYLLLNLTIGWFTLSSERRGEPPPTWLKPVILISIPWAFSIHTVTAFLYSGLTARPFWLTALLTPRFLASAFASGPALLIIICLLIRKFTKFDPGKEAIQTIAKIVAYGMVATVFFLLLELFTVFYTGFFEHTAHFQYLFFGLEGKTGLVPAIWTFVVLAVFSLVLLLNPRTRLKEGYLLFACVMVFISIWIDKGLGLIVPGFIPSVTGTITEYAPTFPEILVTLGVWALGFLLLTFLFKIAVSVKEELAR